MSEKKMVSRSVVIALGIICIILVAGPAGTLIVLNSANSQITSLQSQVNDLNNIVIFNKTEIWLSNWARSIGPNENFTEWFDSPLSGSVEVVGHVQSPNPNIWVNLTWYVDYHSPYDYTVISLYQTYPSPYIVDKGADYFDMEFPIVSFGTLYNPGSRVDITIGNSDPALTSIVNFTITFRY